MKFVLFLGVVAMVFVTGEALKCYQCFNCDEFTEKGTASVECAGSTAACAKGVIKYKNGTMFTGRDCSMDITQLHASIKNTSASNLTLFESANLYFCDSENCNGTGSITGVLSIIFTTLIASIFASF